MTLEQLVTDLSTSQRLKEADFPQDTAFSYYPVEPSEERIDTEGNATGREPMEGDATEFVFMTGECNDAICAAPTAGELEEWLFAKEFRTDSDRNQGGKYYSNARAHDYRKPVVSSGYQETNVAALAQLCLEVAG